MRRVYILGISLVILASTGSASAAVASRSETKSYWALGGDLGVRPEGVATCTNAPAVGAINVGGACFDVRPTDEKLAVTISDDFFDAVGAIVSWRNASNARVGNVKVICGAASDIAVPPGATKLFINVDQVFSVLFDCPKQAIGSRFPGTAGEITAVFSWTV